MKAVVFQSRLTFKNSTREELEAELNRCNDVMLHDGKRIGALVQFAESIRDAMEKHGGPEGDLNELRADLILEQAKALVGKPSVQTTPGVETAPPGRSREPMRVGQGPEALVAALTAIVEDETFQAQINPKARLRSPGWEVRMARARAALAPYNTPTAEAAMTINPISPPQVSPPTPKSAEMSAPGE